MCTNYLAIVTMIRQCAWFSCDPSWFIECVTCSIAIISLINVWFFVGLIWFIECFRLPFCTLTTQYWLKLGWWGRLMRMRLTWKNSQKTLDTSKRLCKHCHYWALQTRKRAGSSLPGESWEGVKSIPRRTTYHTPWILSRWEQVHVYIGPIFGVPNLFSAVCW